MRKSTLLKLCLCFAVALFELPLMAQGVVVWKKDGTQVKFAYEEIDSIVTYNVDEDVEDEPVTPPAVVGIEAVDLGLSVKWASCNVGATSPEEYGDYFAWGETQPKDSYTESNSVTYDLSDSELESRGIIDAAGNLTAEYDAATANWGGNWRMPTLAEMKELINNCTWEWTTLSGVYCRKVTGPNGNSIFLPAAGCRYDEWLIYAGSFGCYWSATLLRDSNSAFILDYSLSDGDFGYGRCNGQAGRPVKE